MTSAARNFDTAAPGFNKRYSTATRCAEAGLRPIVGNFGEGGRGFLPACKFQMTWPTDIRLAAQGHVQRYPECAALALVMGPCRAGNVFALDVDRGHTAGVDGFASVRTLLDEYGVKRFAHGPRWKTPRGGCHVLFRAEHGVPIRNMSGKHGLRPGVDVRAHNGLCTAPPSVRSDGAYEWLVAPWEAEIPMAPDWLVDLVRKVERPSPAPVAPVEIPRGDDRERNRRATYVERALQGELADLALCGAGGRNAALFSAAAKCAAFRAGEPDFTPSEEVMRARLFAACVQNALVDDDGASAVHMTIGSGFQAGRQTPRYVPPALKTKATRNRGGHAPL